MAFLRSWMCGWKMHRPLLSQAWTTTAADADLLFGLELSLWCARCVCDGQVFNSSSLQSSCCFIGCSFCCSWFELPPLARWRRDSPKANEEVMEGGRSSDFLLLCADDGLLLDFFDLLLDDRLLDDDKSKEAAGGEEVPPVWCWCVLMCVCVLLVFDRPDEQPPDLPETETSEQRPPEEPSSIFGGSSNIIINIQRCTSSEVGRKWQGIMFEGCWSRSPFSPLHPHILWYQIVSCRAKGESHVAVSWRTFWVSKLPKLQPCYPFTARTASKPQAARSNQQRNACKQPSYQEQQYVLFCYVF